MYGTISDPFELKNGIDSLKPEEKSELHDLLARLMACKGRSCNIAPQGNLRHRTRSRPNILPMHAASQTQMRGKKVRDDGK